ncbi:MAG: hypothetical protein V4642_00940 [Bacteroidota bacterium]
MNISNNRKRLTIMRRFFVSALLFGGFTVAAHGASFKNSFKNEVFKSVKADSLDDLFEELEEAEDEEVVIPELEELERELGVEPDSTTVTTNPWTLLAGANIRTRQTQNGIDISGKPVFAQNLNLSHESGFGASLGASQLLGTAAFQSFSAGVDYTYSVADWLDLMAGYNYYRYGSDTNNPLAGLSNSITLGASMLFDPWLLDFSYERGFGTDRVDYLSATVLRSSEWGDFTITPLVSATFARYEISTTRAKKLKDLLPGKKTTETTTVSGLNSVIANLGLSYALTKNFSLTASPTLLYTPQESLSEEDFQVNFSVGVNYLLGF